MLKKPGEKEPGLPSTIWLTHPHTLLREGLAGLLRDGGFEVMGQSDTVSETLRIMEENTPDILLLDGELSEVSGETLEALVAIAPNTGIVILTRPQPTSAISDAVQAGVVGFLSVNLEPQEFVQSLNLLLGGHIIVSREMAGPLSQGLASESPETVQGGLTGREREVLTQVAQGSTNKEIAEDLVITENTVKVHLRSILDKLNLRNRQQAAAFAAQEGLISGIPPKPEEGDP